MLKMNINNNSQRRITRKSTKSDGVGKNGGIRRREGIRKSDGFGRRRSEQFKNEIYRSEECKSEQIVKNTRSKHFGKSEDFEKYQVEPVRETSKRTEMVKRNEDRKKKPRGVQNLKQFAATLFEVVQNHRETLFTCLVCGEILDTPVTVDCGHTFCAICLDKLIDNKCCVCKLDISNNSVNVLVHGIILKWRETHHETKNENILPNTKDILGFEPRYHLRNRYVGLQTKDGNVNKVLKRLLVSKHCNTPLEKFRRKTSKLNQQKTPQCHICTNPKEDLLDRSICCKPTLIKTAERILSDVQVQEAKALRQSWNNINPQDFECILCSRCLLNPITTTCGHTFCKECLARVFDHGLNCPLCMSPLKVNDQAKNPTLIVEEALQLLLPQEYKDRIVTSKKDNQVVENKHQIPMFVCTNAFPGVACPLYVYEPRYRLLGRRCLQSPSKKFGMAMKIDDKTRFASYGTLLEVRDAVHLEDGRSILTTIGIRRFRVVDRSEQDGYDTALVQYISDNEVPPDKVMELSLLHDRVHAKASRWVQSLTPTLLAEVERSIGKMPDVERNWITLPDGPSWAWWLMPILPVSSHLQVGFLCSTSLEKRLRAIDKMLEHMKIRMQALERNTVQCGDCIKNTDSCSFNERSVDIPFSHQ